ncbi:acetylglutamate kinase [Candidatus Woesearchaeota archaeon]|nr:acetylglutamate kinase [Candidatus Woesearchaeota archaeon]
MEINQETMLYAKVFKQIPKESFAVIKIGGAIIRDQLIVVASALQYFCQFEIYPIIVCGAGPQIDEELKSRNLDNKKVNGLRVTDATQLKIVVEQLMQTSRQLAEAVKKQGGQATVINDAFLVRKHEPFENQDPGFVGIIEEIEQSKILLAIKKGIIPIIAPIGIDSKGQQYNINADTAAKDLVKQFGSKRFILVTETGGVFNSEGAIISEIIIDTDYKPLVESGQINGGMLFKVNEAKKLLEETEEQLLVHIVAPKNLFTELFTLHGAGTIVKKICVK